MAAGDGARVLSAYLAYRRVAAEATAFTGLAADATRRVVGVGVDEQAVSDVPALYATPPAFGELLHQVLRDVEQEQGQTYAREQLRGLSESLEPAQ